MQCAAALHGEMATFAHDTLSLKSERLPNTPSGVGNKIPFSLVASMLSLAGSDINMPDEECILSKLKKSERTLWLWYFTEMMVWLSSELLPDVLAPLSGSY